ncbi:3',5'-cyclic-AMP phosphodiesterase [Exilibacterium tricleocarpae]|uniref:3',5'-cyclic-AMP phosphodiesterase n=1 Tax=Exilibacterium tricleocarpae TaxID=2591008 RepID=UPI001FE99963|nr:3',5'-cyclic-AMP phosphodiesterase [Exilibacterium tricleocarpae]
MQLIIEPKKQPLRLVQVTDCHLGSNPGDDLLGLDTDLSLHDVLALIREEQPSPDLVLATGDISGCADLPAYQRFLKLIEAQFTVPMAWLAGNHDTPDVMEAALEGRPMPKVILAGNWLVVLLDSSVRGHEHGDLTTAELTFLQDTLNRYSERHTLVFLHHQPVPIGSAWVDQYIVRSAGRFFDIVDAHPQVKGISWGHVHQEFHQIRNGVSLWSTPSTCVQFKPNCDEFTVDHTMPGYRWYDLHPDGRLETAVSRIAKKDYPIDYASSGY